MTENRRSVLTDWLTCCDGPFFKFTDKQPTAGLLRVTGQQIMIYWSFPLFQIIYVLVIMGLW